MKEHPIIFNTPMVQAIRAGCKTQTRRVIKPQPGAGAWIRPHPYEPGDLLWVRETWGVCIFPGGRAFFARRKIAYKADGEPKFVIEKWRSPYHLFKKDARLWLEVVKVRVERVQDISRDDAMDEGIERVDPYKTSPDLPPGMCACWKSYDEKRCGAWVSDPITSYRNLWNSLNAKRVRHPIDKNLKEGMSRGDSYGWEQNPWVRVIEFKRVDHA